MAVMVIETYRCNGGIVTMEPDTVGRVCPIEFLLEHQQHWVTPWCLALADMFDETTDEPIAEVFMQPRWQVFQPGLLLLSPFVLMCTR
jgi:hypothetical protein